MLNIAIFLVLAGITAYLVVTDVYRRVSYVQLGQPENRSDRSCERWNLVFKRVLFQEQVLKDPIAGLMHVLIFWGFIVLLLGTINFILEGLFHTTLPFVGDAAWYNFMKDLAGGAVIIGVVGAFIRRTMMNIPRLEKSGEALLILAFIFTLMVTEILSHGLQFAMGENTHLMSASFLAALTVPWFENWTPDLQKLYFNILWWVHVLVLFAFAYLVPKSKHLHLIMAPFNVYFRDLDDKSTFKKLDFEDENLEAYGVGKVENYTWKQLLDCMSCVHCGRCTDNCPAYQTGKPLSPKMLHVDLRHHLEEKGPILLKQKNASAAAPVGEAQAEAAATAESGALTEAEQAILDKSLIDDVLTEDVLWSCTTCKNCVNVCPVDNEHLSKIIDARRFMVMDEGRVTEECQRTFDNIENQNNPWGIGRNKRADWAKELNVPTVADNPDAEYLLYVGCAGSFDDRNMKITKSLVKLLQAAKVNFAILGKDEPCCGETTRRMGNEYLYETIVTTNVETFNELGIKKVITLCPHCFNTLKNEYPDYGSQFEQVVHHGDFLSELIADGKLKLSNPQHLNVTFHDSCYLGRYNNVYEGPRAVLKAAGATVKEMPRTGEGAFCCGAGGGRMWMEESHGTRINVNRTEEAVATGAEVIASSCPYCLTMLLDGTKELAAEETVKTLDIAEIAEKAL